jgi:hypothetical protein
VVLVSVVSWATRAAPVRTVYWFGRRIFRSVADLGAVLGEAVVVLAVDGADEVQLLVEDAQGFARHRRGGEDGVGHEGSFGPLGGAGKGGVSRRAAVGGSA